MKQNIWLITILLLVTITNAQNKKLEGHSFIIMPGSETYVNRAVWHFSSDKLEIKNLTTKTTNIFQYKIRNNQLIVSDSLNWGNIKYSDEYFELIDKNNSSLQYTKLKTTQIDCNEHELEKIITSSFWNVDLKSKIHIKDISIVEKNKTNYRLVKLDNTYVLIMDNWWNFTIRKISKNTLEFYGLSKVNDLKGGNIFYRDKK